MKKLIIGSVLAISSVLTVTGCTSVNATTDTTPATTTNMQKHHKAGMKNGMHKGGMHEGGMRGAMAQLDLTTLFAWTSAARFDSSFTISD